jgi:N-formylglutamate amidohydrolase
MKLSLLALITAPLVLAQAPVGSVASDQAAVNGVYGERRFIEYQKGSLPLVIAVPHGGRERPADIPDRSFGVLSMDANTLELGQAIAAVIKRRTGEVPHLVVCHLHRSKLDANRELEEAAQGNAAAEKAWLEHHEFIEKACQLAVAKHGFAFLIDLHGHGHPEARVELGYLHTPDDLAAGYDQTSSEDLVQKGSLAWLAERVPSGYADLLYGPHSLGALLEARGFLATPSPRMPVPTKPFFSGGYTVSRHCRPAAAVMGVQIEANRPRLRDTAANRQRFAEALAAALDQFLSTHLKVGLAGRSGGKGLPSLPLGGASD